MRAFSASQTKQ